MKKLAILLILSFLLLTVNAQPRKDPQNTKRTAQGHNFFENVKGLDFGNPDLNQAVIGLLFIFVVFLFAYFAVKILNVVYYISIMILSIGICFFFIGTLLDYDFKSWNNVVFGASILSGIALTPVMFKLGKLLAFVCFIISVFSSLTTLLLGNHAWIDQLPPEYQAAAMEGQVVLNQTLQQATKFIQETIVKLRT